MKSFAFKRRSREPKCRVDTARSNMVALHLKKASEWRSEWNIFIIKTIFSFNCCNTTAFKLTFHERVKCLPVTLGQFANYPTMKQKFARLSKHFTVFPTFGSCLQSCFSDWGLSLCRLLHSMIGDPALSGNFRWSVSLQFDEDQNGFG